MGLFQNMRCKVGSHLGEWKYGTDRKCDQSRRCANCGKISSRVSHGWGEWGWADPGNQKSCKSVRKCGRCDKVEREERHNREWRYTLDVMNDREDGDDIGLKVMATAARALIEAYSKCEQRYVCLRCGDSGISTRKYHDWKYGDTSIRVCARCGTHEEYEEH
jgi:hypothetical protein